MTDPYIPLELKLGHMRGALELVLKYGFGVALQTKSDRVLRDLDLLLLPIGGTFTIDTPEAEALLRLIQPRRAVAMHYRTEACGFNIRSCEDFSGDTNAVRMPREIEITRETLMRLPEVMILDYK